MGLDHSPISSRPITRSYHRNIAAINADNNQPHQPHPSQGNGPAVNTGAVRKITSNVAQPPAYETVVTTNAETQATQAAPSIEACPSDSVLTEDTCKCDPARCSKPPCLAELVLFTDGSDLPGQCCPTYSCVGCANETMIEGKCPCAPGAIIDRNNCVCVDKEKNLVDGECVCNPLQCPLPELCNKKSVAVTVAEGCCKRTICKPCPLDSESTHLERDELEDHCVCLPCKTDCGNNKTAVIKKHGTGFPGSCCDLYECKNPDETKGCVIGEEFYENGKEWLTSDSQVCRCNNGLSLCSKPKEQEAQPCFIDSKWYNDSEVWTKDDECTQCMCKNGLAQCISHTCYVKESHIQKNDSCIKNNLIYQHNQSWIENDGCTKCTCIKGDEICSNELCIRAEDCQPLANCNKTCINGFKINKRGCEICRCNVRLSQEILTKYNITLYDLINILDEYKNDRTSTSSSPPSMTSTMRNKIETIDTIEVIVDRNADVIKDVSSTTTEPSIVLTNEGKEPWVYIAIPVLAGGIFICVIAIMCVYRGRRSSMNLDCQYQTVNNNINNKEKLIICHESNSC